MKDPILLNKLWKEVEQGRVSVSTDNRGLSIFKYTQDCHIQSLWNETNRQARGIIFRIDGTIVARPFRKFFNLNELPESSIDNLPWKESVEVYEKVDGSCGIGYYTDHYGWQLATPGSLESEQAQEGTRILNNEKYILEYLPEGSTPIFEIVYPGNRIVVDYGGASFLSLLAIIDHNGEEWHPRRVDQIAERCCFRRPRRFNIDLRSEIPFEDNSEGYVARFESGLRVKVKSPVYLRIHRLLNYLSPKGVIELIRGHEYGVTLKQLPPMIAASFDDIRAYVQGIHNELLTATALRYRILTEELGENASRKDQAMWIKSNVPNAECGLVFGMLDGRDLTESIWKLVLERVKDERLAEAT